MTPDGNANQAEIAPVVDEAFMEQIFRERRQWGLVIARTNWRFRDEREDVYQEALLGMWRMRHAITEDPGTYFVGIVRNVALSYRARKIDRAQYCEVEDWHLISPAPSVDSDPDPADILNALIGRLRSIHRTTYREWKARGYYCETHGQRCRVTRMLTALREVAGTKRHPSRKFRVSNLLPKAAA